MKKILLIATATLIGLGGISAKKVLDHSDLDSWNKLKVDKLSNNGDWATFSAIPGEGDATLTFYNTRNGKKITVNRGYNPEFSANSQWAIALIKPLFKDLRQAKIDKKKDFDAPQDSLIIINLRTGKQTKIPNVINYKTGKEGGEWIAYQTSDTTLISPKALKDKEAGRPLIVRHLPTAASKTLRWVKDFCISDDGSKVAATIYPQEKDSTATSGIGYISLPDTSFILLDRDKKFYGTPVFNHTGSKLAYTTSLDSVKSGTRKSVLMLSDLTADIQDPEMMVAYVDPVPRANLTMPHSPNDSVNAELYAKRKAEIDKTLKSRLFVTQYSKPEFSHNGNRLIIGLGSYIAPDDTTIYDFERADLDIWRWDSPMTPPQENKNVNKLREKTYPYVIDLSNNDGVLLTNNPLVKVVEGNRWDSNYAMLCDPSDSAISRQWDYYSPEKIYVVNVNNGQRKEVATVGSELAEISTGGNYIIWYADRNYYSYNIASGETVCISEKIPYPIWDEDQDTPSIREPYGTSLWYEGDKALLINDRYDIWKVDPSGKSDPICLTAGEGRKTNRKFRYTALNKDDHRFITPGETLMLRVFDFNNKDYGFATVKSDKSSAPKISDIGPYFVSQLRKAKDNDVYTYQRANFSTSPDAWISVSNNFASAKRVSDINPQMKDYNWGTAELVKWYAYNGDLTEGILYKPEDFDPAKKYPMIVYFYETNSELLNYHYDFEPSWSWINFPFYTSRGYLIFVPDVHYAAGIPGESAYNYICSGVEDLCKRYDWIDKSKIGIDGQSWGGYQTAYLSTRTNMFACAGSGAPVANMTSAFGGIRWESGDSRQAQYEQGQSRIGRNIWEAPELYIANSPVFHADRINNPILIMHNDADGAVPWYQGIELFMALRRLEKPVWMLQYNGEAHNLKERRNRKDITIRLQQFFDHYLKDAPMPEWMKNGIPAVRKGQEFGTTLTE